MEPDSPNFNKHSDVKRVKTIEGSEKLKFCSRKKADGDFETGLK